MQYILIKKVAYNDQKLATFIGLDSDHFIENKMLFLQQSTLIGALALSARRT
jgi:hypothetical protein